jgi:hypothetical protein
VGISGGNVQALTVDPVHPQTVYAATQSTVYKSVNGAGSLVEQALVDPDPGFLADFVIRIKFASQLPEMLAGVIEVDDLDRTGKMKFRQIPDPFGPVAHDHLLPRFAVAVRQRGH